MAEDAQIGGLVTRRNIAHRLRAVRKHRGQPAADDLLKQYRHRTTHIKNSHRESPWQPGQKQFIARRTAYRAMTERRDAAKNWRSYGEPIATGGVSFETQHPRWPKNAPHGRGGKWRPKRGG